MLDIKLIREQPEVVKNNIERFKNKQKLEWLKDLIEKDKEYRKLLKNAEELRHKRNRITSEINELRKAGKNITAVVKEAKEIPDKIKKIEGRVEEIKTKITFYLNNLPTIIHPKVPYGKDATENKEIKKFGNPKKFDFELKNHAQIMEELGMADFDIAASIAGKGFYVLKGDLALLNQALIRFAIDFMTKKGYLYVEPPLMVRKKIIDGVMTFEEMENMVYKIEGEDLHLIGTSEHALIGMYCDKIIPKNELPLKLTGYSMCFRKEIGSHGIDQRGLFRTHQFNKVEQVVICDPEDSWKLYDELIENTEGILKELDLPYRLLEICTGDLNPMKARSCDIEVWSPREKKYIETMTCSNLSDSQSRNLGIKCIDKKGEKVFAHTLNNTALATSRILVAILENFQEKDGSVKIPKVLQGYLGGKKFLKK